VTLRVTTEASAVEGAAEQICVQAEDVAIREKSDQTRPVTTARKDTNNTAVKVNIIVSAISPHGVIAGAASSVVSTGSAGKMAGLSLDIHDPSG
jgi:hypothetical protein